MRFDNAGNDFSKARSLNITSDLQVFSDWVGKKDSVDFYTFRLSGRSSFNLRMDGLSANADVQLLNDKASVITTSNRSKNRVESINTTLDEGVYYIRVYQASRKAQTNYKLKISGNEEKQGADVAVNSWLAQNIQDSGIRAIASVRFRDNVLDRNDAIAIFQDAMDGGIVDATEFTDLRTLVSNASYLKMPEYVSVLSNKLVNGDAANQKYQGNSLGNLYAGSSSTHMSKLIDKWFFGRDLPATPYSYQYASGSLFQNGVSYLDIKQGKINDCYFLVGLATTATRSVSTIESMFVDNGDSTYTVRFWRNGVADYVTVDRYLPATFTQSNSAVMAYANLGARLDNPNNELWVALAEKAYAQLNESGWIGLDNTNSYSGISGQGGYVSQAIAHITGRNTTGSNLLNFTSLVNAYNSGQLIGLASSSTGLAANIVPNHAYALVDYNSSTEMFTVFNPWGVNNDNLATAVIKLTWNELKLNFSYWDSTT